jgi:hypothetical protein
VIGTAEFEQPVGVAHAALRPTPDYAAVSQVARQIGRRLALTEYHSPRDGDFADVVAARWGGDRLALEDMTGRELAINNIVIVETPAFAPDGSFVRVVADFRTDLARTEARVMLPGTRGGGRNRPAA